MGGGGGKSYKPQKYTAPPLPEAPETVAQEETADVSAATAKARRAAALASGRRSTIVTGSLGDTSTAQLTRKTLLGQ